MTSRLKIVIGSAIILVGLLVIVILSVVGATHTGFGQTRVRNLVLTMLEGNVKGKVYVGHMSGGFFTGVTIDSVEIKDDEDSVFFAISKRTIQSSTCGSTRMGTGTGGESFRRASRSRRETSADSASTSSSIR